MNWGPKVLLFARVNHLGLLHTRAVFPSKRFQELILLAPVLLFLCLASF